MKAIILAAGRGSRLYPFTAGQPKCLTEIAGRPLIEHQVSVLQNCGIRDIIIVAGYREELIDVKGTRKIVNDQWAKTNMVASLFSAEDEFSDDFVVSYADILYENRVLEALLGSNAPVSVAINRNWQRYWEARFENPLDDAESLRIDENNRILDIGKSVEHIEQIEGQYMGLIRVHGTGVTVLKSAHKSLYSRQQPWRDSSGPDNAYATDLLMEMIHSGEDVISVPISGGWLEIDTLRDYDIARQAFTIGAHGPHINYTFV